MEDWMQEAMQRWREYEQEEAQQKLTENAGLVATFIKLARSKGVEIDEKSVGYSSILGVIASAPGLASTLLLDFQRERDGLVSFDDLIRIRDTRSRAVATSVARTFCLPSTRFSGEECTRTPTSLRVS